MKPPEWKPYGDDGKGPYQLQRRRGNACRWVRRDTGEQVGPIQSNVAPAVAYAMARLGLGVLGWPDPRFRLVKDEET